MHLVINQQNRIREEIASKYEVVSRVRSLDALVDEYNGLVAQKKIINLCKKYSKSRKIRPDGNCFYRAVLFGAIESSVMIDRSEMLRLRLSDLANRCKTTGYDSFAIEEFHELVDEQISNAMKKASPDECVGALEESIVNDPSIDAYFVAFARCLCGASLKEFQDEYVSFLPQEYSSIESFCRNEVDPMYKDADQIQVVALARLLGIHLRIVYVDQSEGDEANTIEFGDTSSLIKVYMVYKPGHYDLIYP